MKALVFTHPNQLVYRDEPDPVAQAGEVLVRVKAVGICGSDMHAYHGHDPRRVPPLILGHEVAGEVTTGPRSGQPVVVNPLITCGRCAFCESGRNNLCTTRELIGMRLQGAYAEAIRIPERNLVAMPPGLSFETAALTEPAATALHALNLARQHSSRPLAELPTLVIGGGAVGFLTALLLKGYGAAGVTVAETNPLRSEAVTRWIGCAVHDPIHDPSLAEGVFPLVIDAVGGGVTRRLASHAVSPGGILIHIGLMDSAEGLDIRKITLMEVNLQGVYCYSRADFAATAAALAQGLLGDLGWLECRPLADGARAFCRSGPGPQRGG